MKRTFLYLKRSGPLLIVAMAVPAVLLGIFCQPLTMFTFLPLYYKNTSGKFWDIFFLLLSAQSFKMIFPYIIIAVTFLIGFSYGMGIMEKDLKTGKLALPNPLRCVNNTIMSVLKAAPLYFIVLLMLVCVQSGVCSLLRLIISGFGNSPKVLDVIWVGVFSSLMYVLALMLSLCCSVWSAVMQVYGYSFSDAFVEAMRTVSKRWFPLVMELFIPITIMGLPQIILNALNLNQPYIQIVAGTIMHLFILVYFSAYTVIAVFELNGLERRDIKKKSY